MKHLSKYYIYFAQLFVTFILLEGVLRVNSLKDSGRQFLLENILSILLLVAAVSAVFAFLGVIIPKKWGRIFLMFLVGTVTVVFAAQTVYFNIFKDFYTTYSMLNGAQVAEFQGIIFATIFKEIVPLVIIFAIGIASEIIFHKKRNITHEGRIWQSFGAALLTTVLSVGLVLNVIVVEDESFTSPYEYLHRTNEINGSVKSFGLIAATGIDMWRLAVGFVPEMEEPEENFVVTGRDDNVISELDFKALAQEETDPTLLKMDKYFGSRTPTAKNDKTGIFAGKNLIFITAESFSSMVVSEKYTPTLYKLQNEGFNFSNYYNPIWGVSTLDGEYVSCQSLIPKTGIWSMKESSKNYLPQTLGNQFAAVGYSTKAYHNHSIFFYHREMSHPNMGYDFKGQDGGYEFTPTWPESDLEMIDKTTADFLTPNKDGKIQPFHIYYLTVSGHRDYNFLDQDMAIKNRESVADLDMSEPCKAYVAANIEFDKAMELLLQRLDEAGQLENTVIAIAGDHYPYGLTNEQISEFKGHKVDETYEIFESGLILWTPDMEQERVEKVCCNMDILPTLSNMFGLEFDSRLMMGRDIFSDSEGLVILEDKNWITDKGKRDEITNKEYIKRINKEVSEMFNYSALILDEDYYRVILETRN